MKSPEQPLDPWDTVEQDVRSYYFEQCTDPTFLAKEWNQVFESMTPLRRLEYQCGIAALAGPEASFDRQGQISRYYLLMPYIQSQISLARELNSVIKMDGE